MAHYTCGKHCLLLAQKVPLDITRVPRLVVVPGHPPLRGPGSGWPRTSFFFFHAHASPGHTTAAAVQALSRMSADDHSPHLCRSILLRCSAHILRTRDSAAGLP